MANWLQVASSPCWSLRITRVSTEKARLCLTYNFSLLCLKGAYSPSVNKSSQSNLYLTFYLPSCLVWHTSFSPNCFLMVTHLINWQGTCLLNLFTKFCSQVSGRLQFCCTKVHQSMYWPDSYVCNSLTPCLQSVNKWSPI